MPRNRRRPGLIRTAARTAVVAGTATATSRAVANRMDQRAMQSQVNQAAMMPPAAGMTAGVPVAQPADVLPTPTSEPGATGPDLLTQLTQLTQLKDAGALTEEEFSLAKTKLLG